MDSNEDELLCSDCIKLIGQGRHAPPHKKLTSLNLIKINSAMGSADEHYYECKVCGHKWMHETGSCGYGWIK